MFTFAQLRDLERSLRNRKVLSVFVDTSTTGGAWDSSWRVGLDHALARLYDAPTAAPGDATARTLCIAHLETLLEGMRRSPGSPGWVAYVTTDDVVAAGAVRAPVETRVFWQDGIVSDPLHSAVAEPVAVSMADVVCEEVARELDEGMRGIGARLPFPLRRPSGTPALAQATPA